MNDELASCILVTGKMSKKDFEKQDLFVIDKNGAATDIYEDIEWGEKIRVYRRRFGFDIHGEALTVIETGRCIGGINAATKNKFNASFRRLIPSADLYERYGVFQNKATGEIAVASDYKTYERHGEIRYDTELWDLVLPFDKYYPHHFPNPFAAYLIPPNLKTGQRVVIKDLIEDFYGGEFWERKIRLKTLEAIWDGNDLNIDYVPGRDGRNHAVG